MNVCTLLYCTADAYIEEDMRSVSTLTKPYKQMTGAGLHLPDVMWAHKGAVAPYDKVSG